MTVVNDMHKKGYDLYRKLETVHDKKFGMIKFNSTCMILYFVIFLFIIMLI